MFCQLCGQPVDCPTVHSVCIWIIYLAMISHLASVFNSGNVQPSWWSHSRVTFSGTMAPVEPGIWDVESIGRGCLITLTSLRRTTPTAATTTTPPPTTMAKTTPVPTHTLAPLLLLLLLLVPLLPVYISMISIIIMVIRLLTLLWILHLPYVQYWHVNCYYKFCISCSWWFLLCSVPAFCRIWGWNSESGLGILSRWKSMMRTDKTYRPRSRRWDRPFRPFNSRWEDGLDSSCFGIWVIFMLISDLWDMRWLRSLCLMSAGDRRSFGSFVARSLDSRKFQTFALVIQKEGCQSQSDISESQPLKLLPDVEIRIYFREVWPRGTCFSNMPSATTAKAVLVISMTPEQLDEEAAHACGVTCPLP